MPLPLLFYWSLLPKGQTFKWIQFLSPNDWAARYVPRDTSQCWLAAAVDRLVLRDVLWGLCLPTAIPRCNCPWPAQKSSPYSNHLPVLHSTTLPRSHLHRNHHSFPFFKGLGTESTIKTSVNRAFCLCSHGLETGNCMAMKEVRLSPRSVQNHHYRYCPALLSPHSSGQVHWASPHTPCRHLHQLSRAASPLLPVLEPPSCLILRPFIVATASANPT